MITQQKTRIEQHNGSYSDDLITEFIFETKNIDQVEKYIHNALKGTRYRKRKEFFQVDIDVIKSVLTDCENLILKAKNKISKQQQNGGYYIMIQRE